MSTVRRSGGLLLGACAVHDHHLSSGDWVANSQGRQLPGKVLALSRAAAWRAREQTVISRNTAELRHWPDMAIY